MTTRPRRRKQISRLQLLLLAAILGAILAAYIAVTATGTYSAGSVPGG